MKKYTLLLALIWPSILIGQQWHVVEIGQCPTPEAYDLVLADGQNDGTQRLYVTTKNGGVYEWTHDVNIWTLSNSVHPGPINDLMHIAAGEARNDGITRIYFAEWAPAGRIFEAFFSSGTWNINVIGNAPDRNTGVVVGDARNDGLNRLYISGTYGLHEWSWNGSSWSNAIINGDYHEVSGDIGNARNDGINRMVMNTSCLNELSWSGSSFDQSDFLCPPDSWTDAVQIADGRNDNTYRVYVNTTDGPGGRWEYTWTGASWTRTVIDSTSHRGDIHLAKLQADGSNRVYTTTSDYFNGPADDLFEYEWDGAKWIKTGTVVDAISGATAMLTSGIGRNDDTMRMYTPYYVTGGIYEITHISPYVQISATANVLYKNTIDIFPNPWTNDVLHIELDLDDSAHELAVEFLTMDGRKVKTELSQRNNTIDLKCETCTPGMYLLSIQYGSKGRLTKKIIRL